MTIVGLLPLLAVQPVERVALEALPEFTARMDWYLETTAIGGPDFQLARPTARKPHSVFPVTGPPDEGAAQADARRSGFSLRLRRAFGFEVPRARTVSFRRLAATPTRSVTGRRSRTAGYSAATRTGAARCGCRSTICSSSRSKVSTITTGTILKWNARPVPGNLSPSTTSPTN